jgi:hypothetical protein
MEIVEIIDGKFQFHCVEGIVRHINLLYLAKWKERRQINPPDFSQLYDVQ